ncbi:MAG: hypothetical protein AAFY59_02550 [Pseudomonadota bacterium]
MQRLNLLACVPVLDLLENACLIALIVMHPAGPVGPAWLKSFLTLAEFFCALPLSHVAATGLFLAAQNRFQVQ